MAGKGFNHSPNAGEFRRNTSWGRTRQPKNIAGPNGTELTAVTLATLTGITTAGEQPTQGYNTENQRFLHLLVEDSNAGNNDGEAVTAYGYCHAFLRWFPLVATIGGTGAASATAAGVATEPALHLASSRTYRLYDIAGIDRVAFVATAPADVNVFAACSTF